MARAQRSSNMGQPVERVTCTVINYNLAEPRYIHVS